MSNGGPGPGHGVRLAYENIKVKALEDQPTFQVGIIVDKQLVVTTIDRKTGKVISTEPGPLGALD